MDHLNSTHYMCYVSYFNTMTGFEIPVGSIVEATKVDDSIIGPYIEVNYTGVTEIFSVKGFFRHFSSGNSIAGRILYSK